MLLHTLVSEQQRTEETSNLYISINSAIRKSKLERFQAVHPPTPLLSISDEIDEKLIDELHICSKHQWNLCIKTWKALSCIRVWLPVQ